MPGLEVMPGPVSSPRGVPATGPTRTTTKPRTLPRSTRFSESWLSWVPASESRLPACLSRLVASAVSLLASARDASTRWSTRPPVIWRSSSQPTTPTTIADSSNTETTTRACTERRQTVSPRPTSACSDSRGRGGSGAGPAPAGSVGARPAKAPDAGSRDVRAALPAPGRPWSRSGVVDGTAPTGLVADPAHRQHDLGVLGVVLHLGAQPLDVHVDQSGVGGVSVAPHLLEQHLAREHLPRLAGQADEEVELERGEREGRAAAGHRVPRHVDHQVADGERLRRPLREPADARPDPSQQLLRLERLHDVVVGPGLEAGDHVDRVALRGQHHDRDPGLRPDLAADLDAALARQHHVEQHQVGLVLTKG